MKIALAQIKPVKGEIDENMVNHKKMITSAILHKADMIVFPELSITGYEPSLARELATTKDDERFDSFQTISDNNKITICIGAPTREMNGICITLIILQPFKERFTYSKKYLHADEYPFFASGKNLPVCEIKNHKIGFAICYELHVPEHSENAFRSEAEIYIASVAKTSEGIKTGNKTLSGIAEKYKMPVLMVNSIGPSDNFVGAGQSAVWNSKGELIEKMDNIHEGIVIFDTETNTASKEIVRTEAIV